MKKILFFLLFTVSIYGQTYQNPTYGTVTEKNNATDNTPAYFTTTQVDGVHKKTPAALVAKTATVNDSLATKENVANKSDSYTSSSSTTYASTKALVDGLDLKAVDANVLHKTGEETIGLGEKYFTDNVNFTYIAVSGQAIGRAAVSPNEFVIKSQLDLKAPLSSPTFTETPLAPTAAPGTNTTQIATTAFVQAAATSNIAQTITNGVTTSAPSQDAVFDALALKQNALTNPITGTGTTNYLPKFTSAGVLGNSIVQEVGSEIKITGTFLVDNLITVTNKNQYINLINSGLIKSQTKIWNGSAFVDSNNGLFIGGINAGLNNTGSSIGLISGINAGQSNTGSNIGLISGINAGLNNTGSNIGLISGINAGQSNTGSNIGLISGYTAGHYNTGENNILGYNSHSAFLDNASGIKVATAVDINTDYVTITAHNFGATNAYANLRYTTDGTSIGGLANNGIYKVKIIDANTIFFYVNNLSSAGTGNHSFTPQYQYTNVNIFGNNVNPTKSNQTIIGNPSTTEFIAYGTHLIGTTVNNGVDKIQANGTISASPATLSNQVVVKSQLDLKASLSSPTFTETPLAPTAAPGTNTTQIATTAFVQAAATSNIAQTITNGVTTSAPSQDAVFDALAGKASLTGGDFTGLMNFNGGARFPAGASVHFNTGGSGLIDDVHGNYFYTSHPATGWVSNASITATRFDGGIVRLKNYTVATLPTGVQGDTAYVTDALAPSYMVTVVGGGAVVTAVFYNGTSWVAH